MKRERVGNSPGDLATNDEEGAFPAHADNSTTVNSSPPLAHAGGGSSVHQAPRTAALDVAASFLRKNAVPLAHKAAAFLRKHGERGARHAYAQLSNFVAQSRTRIIRSAVGKRALAEITNKLSMTSTLWLLFLVLVSMYSLHSVLLRAVRVSADLADSRAIAASLSSFASTRVVAAAQKQHASVPYAEYVSLSPPLVPVRGWNAVAAVEEYRELPYHPVFVGKGVVEIAGKAPSRDAAAAPLRGKGEPTVAAPVDCYASPYPQSGRFRGIQRFNRMIRSRIRFAPGPKAALRAETCAAAKEMLLVTSPDDCPPGRICAPAAAQADVGSVPTGLLTAFSAAVTNGGSGVIAAAPKMGTHRRKSVGGGDEYKNRNAAAGRGDGSRHRQLRPRRLMLLGRKRGGGSDSMVPDASTSSSTAATPAAAGGSFGLVARSAPLARQQQQQQRAAHEEVAAVLPSSRGRAGGASLMMLAGLPYDLVAYAPWAYALHLGNALHQTISVPESSPLHFYSGRHCEISGAKRRRDSTLAFSGSPWPHNDADATRIVNRLVTPAAVAALPPASWVLPPYNAHYCGWGVLPMSGERYVVIFNVLEFHGRGGTANTTAGANGDGSIAEAVSSAPAYLEQQQRQQPGSLLIVPTLRIETLLSLYDALSSTHTVVYIRDMHVPRSHVAYHDGQPTQYIADFDALEAHAASRIAVGKAPHGSLIVLPRLIGEMLRAEKGLSKLLQPASPSPAAAAAAAAADLRTAVPRRLRKGRGGASSSTSSGPLPLVSPTAIVMAALADASGYIAAPGTPTYLSLLWGDDRPVLLHASRGPELRYNASDWMGMLSGSRVMLSRSQAGLVRLAKAEFVEPLILNAPP